MIAFSKAYCTSTKQTLKGLKNVDVKIHELDLRGDGGAIQSTLKQMTGQRTVPNVFVKGKHLGGNDDTQAAFSSGKLQSMLSA